MFARIAPRLPCQTSQVTTRATRLAGADARGRPGIDLPARFPDSFLRDLKRIRHLKRGSVRPNRTPVAMSDFAGHDRAARLAEANAGGGPGIEMPAGSPIRFPEF